MAIRDIALAAAIAASNPSEQGPKKPENPTPIDTRTVLVQEAVQKAMTTDLTAMKLEDLKSKIQPIILAAGPKDTMIDAVKFPEFIEDAKSEHADFYASLSPEDRKKVNDFYEGLMKIAQTERQKKVANVVMYSYTRFIKAVSNEPGVLIGYAESSLKFVIKDLKRGGFPDDLGQELSKYITLAQKADEPMLLAKAELKEVEAKLEKAIKERKDVEEKLAESREKLAESREKLAESREKLAESREKLAKKKAELDNLIKNLEALRSLARQKQG